MNFNNLDEIKSNGFTGFKTVSELTKDSSDIDDVKGIYLFLYLEKEYPTFLEVGSGPPLYKKKRNPNVSIEKLKANWVTDTIVVYIGKGGGLNQKGIEGAETLRSRLRLYFSFGKGNDVTHWGGRLIWQLSNSKDLVVCWKKTPNEEPATTESKLLEDFKSEYKKLPFANLRR